MSPGRDTLIESAVASRNLPALYAALPLLKELDPGTLAEIVREIEWFALPGGAPLYRAGQPVDGLFVVVNGALGVYAALPDGGSRLCGTINPGEMAGEMELLSGKVRSTTLITLRDSEVARIPLGTFEKLTSGKPVLLREIALMMARRFEELLRSGETPQSRPRTLNLQPAQPGVDVGQFATQLLTNLRRCGRAELVNADRGRAQTTQWFHRLERENEFVVYVSDPGATSWSRLCARQSDRTLMLIDPHRDAGEWSASQGPGSAQAAAPAQATELVMLNGRGTPLPASWRAWLGMQPHARHHHVSAPSDVERLARFLTGRSRAVVLSGGGARGFAHVGVMRALAEARLPVDAIGATSIGAIIGAGWACGWDYPELRERIRRCFVDVNPLADYTLPLLALAAGRRVNRLLRQEFGSAHIEDLRTPFFCVSANLRSGQSAIHQRGNLWLWLRAAASIPGVLPPVFTGGEAYVDGATLNNLPVEAMRELFGGAILAVDVTADQTFHTGLELNETPPLWQWRRWRRRAPRINILQILLRAGMINSAATTIAQRQLADLVIKPPLERVNLLEWRAFDRVIEIGYRHASENMHTIAAALNRAEMRS